jgi:hypothetical protein
VIAVRAIPEGTMPGQLIAEHVIQPAIEWADREQIASSRQVF